MTIKCEECGKKIRWWQKAYWVNHKYKVIHHKCLVRIGI